MDNKSTYFRGCLLGLAVGDAMGYTVDKKSWYEIERDYGPNGLLGYDLVNGCADITSYTQLAAFACNGLLLGTIRGNAERYGKFLTLGIREWAKSQQFRSNAERTYCWLAQVPQMRRRHCMDTRMLDALARPTLGTPEAPVLRSDTPCALTAAIAAGLCAQTAQLETLQIGRLGAEAVACTHGDPETFLAGAYLAYAIAGILQSPAEPLSNRFSLACTAVEQQFEEQFPQVTDLTAKIRKAMELPRDTELSPLAAMTLLGCTTAAECMAGAVYACMIHPANFDEAMIAAVNHSGRSGAVGAITGALLGAKLGFDALPEFYLESLEPVDILCELADDLTQARQLMRIFDDSWDQKYVQGMPAH